jgi:tetratricopeptide (TPR) repeat protein
MRYLNRGLVVAVLSASAMLVDGSPSRAVAAQPNSNPAVVAQTVEARKAEADRLFQQGIKQHQISQFTAALQSWQQALVLYREIKDRQGEGNALGNLGLAYQSLGNYGKAIEFHQQSLAIKREIKNRRGEGASLGNLGSAYLPFA